MGHKEGPKGIISSLRMEIDLIDSSILDLVQWRKEAAVKIWRAKC